MKPDKQIIVSLMKIEAKLALDVFTKHYKKATKGIQKLYVDLVLSKDYNEVIRKYRRFFGYIQKSKKAKEKWEE